MADMGKLAMRLQSLPETDRRTFLEAMLGTISAGNLKLLVEFFKSDDVLKLISAEADWGPLKVIEEILKNYDAVCKVDEGLARQLLERFLIYLFSHQNDVGIDDAFVWLQPLLKYKLLDDGLELVASKQWTAPVGADGTQSKRFELKCRRVRASRFRRQRSYAEADEELRRLYEEWRSFDPREMQELSVLEYEMGYSAFLQGNVGEAADAFFAGAQHAAEAHDRVREIIDSFCGYYTQFHGRVLDPHEARKQFERRYQELLDHPGQQLVDAWLSTIQGRLFEVACALGDAETAEQFAVRLKDNLYLKSLAEDVHERFAARKVLAFAAVVQCDWKTALRHFACFLDSDLTRWGEPDAGLVRSLHDEARGWDELAVCYREAGIALRGLGETGLARRVWERGLSLPANCGNTFFQNDIRGLLAELDGAQP
jgi:hypothetical protein